MPIISPAGKTEVGLRSTLRIVISASFLFNFEIVLDLDGDYTFIGVGKEEFHNPIGLEIPISVYAVPERTGQVLALVGLKRFRRRESISHANLTAPPRQTVDLALKQVSPADQ